ncbi:hypothetical protein OAG43_04810 [Verrucomicrobia bacterium]|nr:hypothetical protein [Verrucomicrobiota bacterium]
MSSLYACGLHTGVMNDTVDKSIFGVSSFIACCLMACFLFQRRLTKSLFTGWLGMVGRIVLGSVIGIFSSCEQNPTRISIQEYFLLLLYFLAT